MISHRCNECDNCQHVLVIQRRMLGVVNQAANKQRAVSDDAVFMWNETLKTYPCTRRFPINPSEAKQ